MDVGISVGRDHLERHAMLVQVNLYGASDQRVFDAPAASFVVPAGESYTPSDLNGILGAANLGVL